MAATWPNKKSPHFDDVCFWSKKLRRPEVFTVTPPLGFPNLSWKPTTKKASATKQDHPYEMSLILEE